MVSVEFLGPIKKEPLMLDVGTLSEIAQVLKQDEQIAQWLESCAVAVNDKIINSKDITLKDGDKISILPPVCGG